MNISRQHKRHNGTRPINTPSIPPPPLIPAPHLVQKQLNRSTNVHHITSSSPSNAHISYTQPNLQHNDDVSTSLVDAYLEIDCLKSTIMATNDIISSNKEEMKRLELKSVDLETKLADEKKIREKQTVELARLQTLIADSEKDHKAYRIEIANLEAELNRLRAALDRSVDDSGDVVPVKKRKKMHHECSHCGYSTFRGNAMKIHREEGCRSAVVEKFYSCDVCKGKFTYNSYRYHLNQYTKQSSHAKNGHQNYSPAKHRQMLEKLKQTKQ